MSLPVSNDSGLDNFLYGMALTNHATYLQRKWKSEEMGWGKKIAAYIAGTGEHILYLLFKIFTAVSFFFLDTVLTIHYLSALLRETDEAEITKRKIRLFVGILVIGESIPGICIDAIGIACPPLANKIHFYIREKITHRYFEKWGIIDHTLTSEEFSSLNYFAKI